MKAAFASLLLVSLVVGCAHGEVSVAQGEAKAAERGPTSGFVADAGTAVSIGKVVLGGLLTPDDVEKKQFSKATLAEGVWTVSFWESKDRINFPVVIQIRQKTGAVIRFEDPNA